MQSGISASKELTDQFNEFLASDRHFGLLVTIASEALEPVTFLSSSSSSFSDNLSLLTPHIKPDEALYILLKRYETSPRLVAVTYVPDSAKVRQKMLFASTQLTLVRSLGSEHFRETIFTTTAKELTAKGFQDHDAHVALDAPLTEEEQSLGAVKEAEREVSQGTGTREIHLSKNLSMPVQKPALDALRDIVQENGRVFATLKINVEDESVELVPDNSSPASVSELAKAISPTEPRFTFYRFHHTHAGQEFKPLLFFYTCPVTPGTRAVKSRMIYPLMKRAVLEVGARECGFTAEKMFQVEEPSEITEEDVLAELHPKAQARAGFSRPKRPGR